MLDGATFVNRPWEEPEGRQRAAGVEEREQKREIEGLDIAECRTFVDRGSRAGACDRSHPPALFVSARSLSPRSVCPPAREEVARPIAPMVISHLCNLWPAESRRRRSHLFAGPFWRAPPNRPSAPSLLPPAPGAPYLPHTHIIIAPWTSASLPLRVPATPPPLDKKRPGSTFSQAWRNAFSLSLWRYGGGGPLASSVYPRRLVPSKIASGLTIGTSRARLKPLIYTGLIDSGRFLQARGAWARSLLFPCELLYRETCIARAQREPKPKRKYHLRLDSWHSRMWKF